MATMRPSGEPHVESDTSARFMSMFKPRSDGEHNSQIVWSVARFGDVLNPTPPIPAGGTPRYNFSQPSPAALQQVVGTERTVAADPVTQKAHTLHVRCVLEVIGRAFASH